MKRNPKLSLVLWQVLDIVEDLVFFATRPSMNQMARYWGYTEQREAYRAFQRWQAEKYIEKVQQGEQVLYRLGAKGKTLLAQRRPSPDFRKRAWDGQWRMVVFDFPEVARKARDAFRRQLRQQRMGCLQKSVWISPDSVIPAWKRILKETELTEWVLLFESAELGPVDDVEIAEKVWQLGEVDKSYERYLSEFQSLPRELHRAKPSALEGEFARRVRRESQVYFEALDADPILPDVLSPPGFKGSEADALHKVVRDGLRTLLLGAGTKG
jgi:DNA-binding transcriptional regulator PaaX